MFWLYVLDIKGLIDSNVILFKFYFERDESQRVTFCMLILMLLYFKSFSLPQEKEQEKKSKDNYKKLSILRELRI